MWNSQVSVVLLVHCVMIYRLCIWADDLLSSIKHQTHNLWNIYMVRTAETNTDAGVMNHQICTISEWIPICGYDEQHKKMAI